MRPQSALQGSYRRLKAAQLRRLIALCLQGHQALMVPGARLHKGLLGLRACGLSLLPILLGQRIVLSRLLDQTGTRHQRLKRYDARPHFLSMRCERDFTIVRGQSRCMRDLSSPLLFVPVCATRSVLFQRLGSLLPEQYLRAYRHRSARTRKLYTLSSQRGRIGLQGAHGGLCRIKLNKLRMQRLSNRDCCIGGLRRLCEISLGGLQGLTDCSLVSHAKRHILDAGGSRLLQQRRLRGKPLPRLTLQVGFSDTQTLFDALVQLGAKQRLQNLFPILALASVLVCSMIFVPWQFFGAPTTAPFWLHMSLF
jgi:hypothetical protein